MCVCICGGVCIQSCGFVYSSALCVDSMLMFSAREIVSIMRLLSAPKTWHFPKRLIWQNRSDSSGQVSVIWYNLYCKVTSWCDYPSPTSHVHLWPHNNQEDGKTTCSDTFRPSVWQNICKEWLYVVSHYKQFMAIIDSNQHEIRNRGNANLISSTPLSPSHIEAVI